MKANLRNYPAFTLVCFYSEMSQIIEKEIKILEINLPALISRIESFWGKRSTDRSTIHDTYFEGEAIDNQPKKIRIRRYNSTDIITMKIGWSAYDTCNEFKQRREYESDIARGVTKQTLREQWLTPWREKYKTRISFTLEDIICDIDLYPGIPPLVEIEWTSKRSIRGRIEKLWLWSHESSNRWSKHLFKRYQKSVLPVVR